MSKRSEQNKAAFQEVCVWCGEVIHSNRTKPSRGMCLKCFARMMREHARAFQSGDRSREASDR
jgi:hypothetical protein